MWTTSSGLSDRCAGLLLPSFNVHALHEEPQAKRKFRDEAENLKVGG